jgi:hypothetical protein
LRNSLAFQIAGAGFKTRPYIFIEKDDGAGFFAIMSMIGVVING